jgi:SAM-dependent methyltransferase
MKKSQNYNVSSWNNKDNIEFQDMAARGGLDSCCDVDIVYPFIEKTASLIEPGAGYGRVIGHLLKKGYSGKIYAIERSKKLFNHLMNEFQNKTELFNADIQTFTLPEKVDAILWMWCNISDFHKDQQLEIISHLAHWLKPEGIFVIETISHDIVPKNATSNSGQTYAIETNYGTAKGYIPSSQEIETAARSIGFQVKKIPYTTPTDRSRIIHILSR